MVGRVIVGTLVYICIVVLAAPFPSAAGLMLTFPALNGLGFFFAERSSVGAMARSMLWLPVINGALCVGYMITFLMLMRATDQWVLALVLFVAVVLLWFLIAFCPEVRRGIPKHRQLPYAVICTLVGLFLVVIAHFLLPQASVSATDVGIFSWQSIARVVLGNKTKIVLFAAALTIFLAAVTRAPDEVRGILAGLPLVPFGGLLSVAGFSDLDVEKQQRVFENMLTSVALGPAVAVWFIFGFSRYLRSRRILSSARLDRLMRFMSLIAGWMLCAIAVAAVSCALIAAS